MRTLTCARLMRARAAAAQASVQIRTLLLQGRICTPDDYSSAGARGCGSPVSAATAAAISGSSAFT
jgi:hypothetical protein